MVYRFEIVLFQHWDNACKNGVCKACNKDSILFNDWVEKVEVQGGSIVGPPRYLPW